MAEPLRLGDLTLELAAFWTERHLCTLTTLRPDGSPHVVAVGVALDPEHDCAWVITSGTSAKVRHVRAAGAAGARVAVCQVDGRRWATLEGLAQVHDDAATVARAVDRYALRYRRPRPNPARVALRIAPVRMLSSAGLRG